MSCCSHQKEVVKIPEGGPKVGGPYSLGVKACCFVFCAGQLGADPGTGNLVEGGLEAETRQAILNLKTILEAAGSSLEKVVKTTVFLRDINDFSRMNSVYSEYFKDNPPARSAFQVGALPRAAAVEIEAVGLLDCEDED